MNSMTRRGVGLVLVVVVAVATLPSWAAQTTATKPVKVTIQEEKAEISEVVLPFDATQRVEFQYVNSMSFGVTAEGKRKKIIERGTRIK